MSCSKTREPESGVREPESGRRKPRPGDSGFTLVEVMIAMAIIGITAVVLLEQRIQIVRDAGRARDLRTAWVLTSQKLAEMELDKTLWTGLQTQSNGDFGDVSSEFASFLWEYQIVREPIDVSGENDPPSDQKPHELLKLTLAVRTPGIDGPIVLEAEFPIKENKPEPPAASTDPSATGAPPSSSGGTTPPGDQPSPGGPKK